MGVTFAPLAEAYRRAGDHVRALEVLAAGLLNHPAYVPALIVQARCHLDVGEDQPAEASFRSVVEGDRHNLIALKGLADICERGGRTAEALGFLDRLLEADPTHEEARAQAARLAGSAAVPAEAPVVVGEELPPTPLDLEESRPDSVAALADTTESDLLQIEVIEEALPDPGLADSPHEVEVVVEGLDDSGSSLESGQSPTDRGEELGIEREEGPFDDFSAAEWSAPVLEMDDAPDQPFEEAEVPGAVAPLGLEQAPVFEASDETPAPREQAEESEWYEAESFESPPAEVEEGSPWVAEVPPPDAEEDALPVAGFEATVEVHSVPWEAPTDMEQPAELEETTESPEAVDAFGWGGWLGAARAADQDESSEHSSADPELNAASQPVANDQPEEASVWMEPETAEPARVGADQGLDPVAGAVALPVESVAGVNDEVDLVEVVEGAAAEAPQDAPPAEIEPDLVITETMARVFERQGHHTMALAVYAQLLEREPDSESIRDAINRLKAAIAPADAGDESVGQFLARRIGPEEVAPEHVAPPMASLDAPPTAVAPEPVRLGAIFGPPRPAPARPAGESAETGPSFDEFFAGGPGPTPGEHRPSEDEELEQFSAWLRTLKH